MFKKCKYCDEKKLKYSFVSVSVYSRDDKGKLKENSDVSLGFCKNCAKIIGAYNLEQHKISKNK